MVWVATDKLTIATAVEAKTSLMVALDSGEDLELDAHAVSEVDVAGLQLLLATRREAEARGRTFSLPESLRSKALVQALALAGMTEALGAPRLEMSHG